METHRCFFAVKCPAYDQIRRSIQRISSDLDLKINPVDPSLYHFTIHFFGDINNREIDNIRTIFSDFSIDSFTVKLSSTGYIPYNRPGKVRVLYIGADAGSNQLTELYHTVRKKISSGGFSTKKKRFLPHMTAARVKYGRDKHKLTKRWMNSSLELATFEVDSLSLIKSDLTSSGPIYTELSVFG